MCKQKRYLGIYFDIKFLGSKPNPNTEYVKSKNKDWLRTQPDYEIWVEKGSE